jgi:hypothetical protein
MEGLGDLSQILAGLNGSDTDKLQSLHSLYDFLIFSEGGGAEFRPMIPICEVLTEFIDPSGDPEILSLTLQCLSSFIPLHPIFHLFLARSDVFRRINAILSQTEDISMVEQCFQLASVCSDGDFPLPTSLVDLRHYFRFFPVVSRICQRSCVSSLRRLSDRQEDDSAFVPFLSDLSGLLSSDDRTIRREVSGLVSNLCDRVPVGAFDVSVFQGLCEGSSDVDVVRFGVRVLARMCAEDVETGRIAARPPDFGRLLFAFDDLAVCEGLLRISQHLIPRPRLPPFLWRVRRAGVGGDGGLVGRLEPVLVRFLVERTGNEVVCVETLAGCWSIVPVAASPALLSRFVDLSRTSAAVPYLIAIVGLMGDRGAAYRSGLIGALSGAKIPKSARAWGERAMAEIVGSARALMRPIPAAVLGTRRVCEICEYLRGESVSPFEFVESALLDHSIEGIEAIEGVEAGLAKCDVGPLAAAVSGLVGAFRLEKVRRRIDVAQFSREVVLVRARSVAGDVGVYRLPLLGDFCALEGWYNLSRDGGLGAKLHRSIEDNVFLQPMLELEDRLDKSHQRFALYCRGFQCEGYRRCSFRIEGVTFSVFDNVVSAVSRAGDDFDGLRERRLEVEIIEEESRRSDFVVKKFEYRQYGRVFRLMELLQEKFGDQFSVSRDFQDYVFAHLADPVGSLSGSSRAIRLILNYPKLFRLEQRVFVFRVVGLDSSLGLSVLQQEFHPAARKLKMYSPVVKCLVDRETLFGIGCFLLDRFGPGRIRLQFRFSGDLGFGEGPSQEFFTSMGREFCRRELGFWLDDTVVESEVAVWRGGLFPRPGCDSGLLSVLGSLCGKALLSHKVLPIPIHRGLFKIVKGEAVSLDEIDGELAESLKCIEGLYDLDFVYPGTGLELKPHGKSIRVNPGNVGEYVELVRDIACGEAMRQRMQSFVRGFESIVHIGSLRVLSSDEVSRLICGDDEAFAISELREFVKLEHGYDSGSEVIDRFYSVCESFDVRERGLFVQFVTGCSRLPVGGLSGLKPRLTVARRVSDNGLSADESLPSVMTCTNYLKLPPYSSVEVMRSRLVQAITECQNAFLLS